MSTVKLVNQLPATGSVAMYSLIDLLASQAGWSKTQDSDGSVFSSSGTQVTSGSAGAGGLANDRAWVLLRAPDSSIYISIQHRDDATNIHWRFKCSTIAPTGGTATQVPAAADDQVYAGGGTDASPTFNDEVIGEADGSTYRFNAVASTTAPYVFCAWTWADPASPNFYISSLIFLDYIQAWTQVTGDVFPYVLKAKSVGSGGDNGNISALSDHDASGARNAPYTWLAKGLGGAGFQLMPMVGRHNFVTSEIAPGLVPLNPVTSEHDLIPIEYIRPSGAATPVGFKGWSTLFSWLPLLAHVTGDMYTVASTQDNIVLSHLVLNLWDGDTPAGTGTTPATRDGRIFTAPSPDATAPTVTNLSPAAGSTITTNTALQFDVTDTTNAFRRILIKLSYAGASHWEIAHDGDAFASNFSAGSTRSAIANGYRYSLLRAGGWPSSVTVTPIAIDVTGNENS